ncbi:hypothetical protein ACTL32_12965 [Planococcus sp. FY231025]|uniref:hypothetical protein n=1 Tax=Planococcus sp. FY231025 TaxID=3455699 RepID=UPI003F8E0CC7
METRRIRKTGEMMNDTAPTGLSYGLSQSKEKSLDRKPNMFWDFITQAFLFLLGGAILCGLLYALVTFT